MGEKLYFSYQTIHKTAAKVAAGILKSGFKPDVMIAIGNGGRIPAQLLQEYINKPIIKIGIKFYDKNNKPCVKPIKNQWPDRMDEKLKGKNILLVDEVDDTRTTLSYCLHELLLYNPKEIAVAVLHFKNKEKLASFPQGIKHYFVGEEIADVWTCYPWERGTELVEEE